VYFIMPPQDSTVSFADDAPPISILVWQPFTAPASPDWKRDIEPILGAYARLYPGMREKVDIGAQSTARANASSIAGRLSLPMSDPSYMPVTRDLSPAKVQMIVNFMQQWAKGQGPVT
jgi:hypothetical protein